MDNILEISNLSKHYPTFDLQNISFSVPCGSIVGLVGENGAGKTTTIKLILNEIRRDSGNIRVFGMDNIREERKIKELIGVVFDESYFYGEFRAQDIASILKKVYRTWDDALFSRCLAQFKLPKDKMIREYSKGMKMKLSIASALRTSRAFLFWMRRPVGWTPSFEATFSTCCWISYRMKPMEFFFPPILQVIWRKSPITSPLFTRAKSCSTVRKTI